MSTIVAQERLQKLAARLQSARQALQIYPPKHPQLESALENGHGELRRLLGQEEKVQIAFSDGEFVLGTSQIPAQGEVLEEFGGTFDDFSVNKLIFKDGVRRDEMQRFLQILAREPEEVAADGGLEEVIRRAGIVNIEAGSVAVDPGELPNPEALFRTWEAYSTGLKVVRAIKQRVHETGGFDSAEEVKEFAYRLTELAMQETRPLLAVHSLKAHDEYSFTHSINVAMLTLAMAQNMPFSRDDLHEIAIAALLHDVGKEAIPREILQKPGKLTPDEWKIVNRHGVEGARILAKAKGVGELAPIVAFEHHLSYHEELRDEAPWEPHIASQIVALADVYDALRSIRPYRGEMAPDLSMRVMQEDAGKKFNPTLFDGFYRMVGVYPPGTILRLDSGILAVAYANNPAHPDAPQVVFVRHPEAGPEIEGEKADLASPDATETVSEVVSQDDTGINPVNYL